MNETKTISKKKVGAIALTAALALSAIGASFAWMTSNDKITNSLETDGRQETSLVEIFNPPTEWTPGQTIVKDVMVENSGDVDSFVRVSLTESIETNVESTVDTAGTGTPVIYTDEKLAQYPTTVDNNGVVPADITVNKNDTNGYIAYVTATKQKVNLQGLAYVMDEGTPKATLTGDLGITYSVTTKTIVNDVTMTPLVNISNLEAGQKYGDITLTDADVVVLNRYINSAKDNLYLTSIDGTPIVLVLDENWTSNWSYNDGYFYYKRILTVGSTTESLLKDLILLPQATNDYANAKYDVVVEHDGIQATVDCIADIWGAEVAGNTATIGDATVDTTGAIVEVA